MRRSPMAAAKGRQCSGDAARAWSYSSHEAGVTRRRTCPPGPASAPAGDVLGGGGGGAGVLGSDSGEPVSRELSLLLGRSAAERPALRGASGGLGKPAHLSQPAQVVEDASRGDRRQHRPPARAPA